MKTAIAPKRANSILPVLRQLRLKFVTDRQRDKSFDTIYLGVCEFFLSVIFATSLLASLAGDKLFSNFAPYVLPQLATAQKKFSSGKGVSCYSNHLNTGLVWYSNDWFVSGCRMVQYSNGGLKTGLKKACLWSKMSGIQMVHQVTWLYHLNTRHPYCAVLRRPGCCIAVPNLIT